jgi:IS5 family transposase
LKSSGIDDRAHPLSDSDQIRDNEITVTRAGGERPFATYKQHYSLARTRCMGLVKNTIVYGLAAIAANLRKRIMFLTLYGVAGQLLLNSVKRT